MGIESYAHCRQCRASDTTAHFPHTVLPQLLHANGLVSGPSIPMSTSMSDASLSKGDSQSSQHGTCAWRTGKVRDWTGGAEIFQKACNVDRCGFRTAGACCPGSEAERMGSACGLVRCAVNSLFTVFSTRRLVNVSSSRPCSDGKSCVPCITCSSGRLSRNRLLWRRPQSPVLTLPALEKFQPVVRDKELSKSIVPPRAYGIEVGD